MNHTKLNIAQSAASEFLARVKEVRGDEDSMQFNGGTKKTAALRRSSMELTRALAQLRRPG